jgi:nucleotide-binding universal stress UspA family protein
MIPYVQVNPMKVLVAVDTSETSREALEQVLKLLNLQTSTVLLLSVEQPVVTPPTSDMPGFFSESPELSWQEQVQMVELEKDRAETALTWAEALCKQAGVTYVLPRLEVGDPKHVICNIAKQEACDVIALEAQHKGLFERVLMGSVSDFVVHHAQCPVLVIP